MKHKYLCFLIVALFLCGCTAEPISETTAATEPFGATEIGTSSYSCITIEESSRSESTVTATYTHQVYNPNDEAACTLTVNLLGSYHSEKNTSSMTHVSAVISDAAMGGFSVSEHLSGNTGTVILYLNQISVCHFQYRIHPDGTLEFL